MTVTGKTLGENLEDLERGQLLCAQPRLPAQLRPGARRRHLPCRQSDREGLGRNPARQTSRRMGRSSSIRPAARKCASAKAPARVFDREEDAYQAVVDGRVEPGDILVIRYEGPRGSGMPENAHDDRGHRLRRKAQRHRLARHRRAVLGRKRAARPSAMSRRKPPAAAPLAFIETGGHHRLQRQKPHAGRCRHRRGGNARPKRSPACWPNAPKRALCRARRARVCTSATTSHALSAMQGAGYED